MSEIKNENGVTVFESKFGWHPCDYETFKKLKKLHKYYWEAVKGLGDWFRWNAKQPQNRVITKRIRDDNGHVIRKEIVGPWEEPKYHTVFGRPSYRKTYTTVPEHLNDDFVRAYQKARMPQEKDRVSSPGWSIEEIDKLIAEIENIG